MKKIMNGEYYGRNFIAWCSSVTQRAIHMCTGAKKRSQTILRPITCVLHNSGIEADCCINTVPTRVFPGAGNQQKVIRELILTARRWEV